MKVIKGIIIVIVLFGMFASACYVDHNYTRKNCSVVYVTDEIVRVKDNCGNLWDWEIEEEESFSLNDTVTLKMNDNCTSNYIEDDIVTKIIKK